MFRRRQVKTHGRLMREELNEGLEHLRLAATHAAGGAAGVIAPRMEAARDATVPVFGKARDAASDGMDSLFDAARTGTRKTSRGARSLRRKGRATLKAGKATAGSGAAVVTAKIKAVTPGLAGKPRRATVSGRRWPVMIGGLLVAGAAVGAAASLMKRRRARQSWNEYDTVEPTAGKSALLDSATTAVDAGVDTVSHAAATARDRTSDLVGARRHADPATNASAGPALPGENKQPTEG